ncbi:MAG: alkaline phosphatase family protein [Chloroflexota bacterium]
MKPLYETYCFSQIPQTIHFLLTGQGAPGLPESTLATLPRHYDKVILLFIDGFGWRFFERYCDKYPFLKRFISDGVVSKLTSQFPSTTSAHTTTIHTGLPVGESGVFEWAYYEPLLDQIISPLLFSFSGDKGRNTLSKAGISPQMLFPRRTVYQSLQQQDIKSYVFQHRDYTPSPFTNTMFAGAQVSAYKTFAEALLNLGDALLAEPGKAYYFLYFDSLDSISHVYGPGSRHFEAEVDTFLSMMERLFYGEIAGKLKNTLLLMTADHGQVEISPETTIYLNQLTSSIESFIKTNHQGQLLVPAGAPRDMFLYIKDEHLDEAHAQLSRQFKGRAEVHYVRDLIDQGFSAWGILQRLLWGVWVIW